LHADNFAGLTLVPGDQLLEEYRNALIFLQENNYEIRRPNTEMINKYVSIKIAKSFKVSDQVIIRRLGLDDLTPFSIPW